MAEEDEETVAYDVDETEEDDALWIEASKRHALNAYAEEDAIYDDL